VKKYPKPLCSDAKTGWLNHEPKKDEMDDDLEVASMLLRETIRQAAEELVIVFQIPEF
jgi:hypothetical protein